MFTEARAFSRVTYFLAWAWLAKANGHSCHTKKSTLAKYLRKKKRVKVRSTTGHYAAKKRPVKITMYLGLDIIIKLKFTTNFDKCAIFNVLSYLTKNFVYFLESQLDFFLNFHSEISYPTPISETVQRDDTNFGPFLFYSVAK